ncbi:hypothetical protein HDU83_004181 [Entophlyctis luteolus]|nr:hypothetical protein HDU83_004181 [Entophlyctis luteolus]
MLVGNWCEGGSFLFMEFNSVIVGAGPTGLTLAAELLRQGIPADTILLVDELAAPLLHTKASVLWPRSLELLDHFAGVVPAAEAVGMKLLSGCIFAGDNQDSLKRLALINISSYFISSFPWGILLEQWRTERILTEYLARHNLHVTRSTKLVDYKYFEDGAVEARFENSAGMRVVRTKFLVGCDGGKSKVRKLLGFDFKGETLKGSFYSAHFTVKNPLPDINTSALSLFLMSSGGSFVTPMPGHGKHSISYMSALDLSEEQDCIYRCSELDSHGNQPLLEIPRKDAERLLQERLSKNIVVDEIIWQSHFRVNERVTSSFSDGRRVFLAGDACHAHSPIGGQGQNTGIQEAINLGWKLALVIKGLVSPELLSTYERERQSIGQRLVDFTNRGTKASALRDPTLQYLRNTIMSFVASREFLRDTIAQTIAETIYNYRKCDINSERWEKPALIPFFWQRRRQNILRVLTERLHAGDRVCAQLFPMLPSNFFSETAGFKAIFFQGRPYAKLPSDLSLDALHKLGEELVKLSFGTVTAYAVVTADDCSLSSSIGVQNQCVLLIRPDDYVALRSEPVSFAVVAAYLRDKIGQTKFGDEDAVRSLAKYKPLMNDWVHGLILLVLFGAFAARRLCR